MKPEATENNRRDRPLHLESSLQPPTPTPEDDEGDPLKLKLGSEGIQVLIPGSVNVGRWPSAVGELVSRGGRLVDAI